MPRLTSYDRDGLRFDVVDRGPLDGPVVILLHGFPERASCWDAVAPLLRAAGYRTLAPDQRGYSPGARPAGRKAYATVAWTYAARYPDRLHTLAAVSVGHTAAFLRSWLGRQALRSWYMFFFQLTAVPEWLARRRGGAFDRLLAGTGMTPAELDRFRAEIVEAGALTSAINWYRAMPFAPSGLVRTPVTAPTTLVWSDGDTAVGRASAEGTARWVRAPYRFHVLEGVSHWIPRHAPDRLAPLLLQGFGVAGEAAA